MNVNQKFNAIPRVEALFLLLNKCGCWLLGISVFIGLAAETNKLWYYTHHCAIHKVIRNSDSQDYKVKRRMSRHTCRLYLEKSFNQNIYQKTAEVILVCGTTLLNLHFDYIHTKAFRITIRLTYPPISFMKGVPCGFSYLCLPQRRRCKSALQLFSWGNVWAYLHCPTESQT